MRDPLPCFRRCSAFTAKDIVDGLFEGLEDGRSYIIVEHPEDTPVGKQIAQRAGAVCEKCFALI